MLLYIFCYAQFGYRPMDVLQIGIYNNLCDNFNMTMKYIMYKKDLRYLVCIHDL